MNEETLTGKRELQVCSMYDHTTDADDNLYFPTEYFTGYSINKTAFFAGMLGKGIKADRVILSHINLLPVGWLIKKLSPKTELILLAHGIEIWERISSRKLLMLKSCDSIVSVSQFTRNKVITIHGIPAGKCSVLNNCLDPFLPRPSVPRKNKQLLAKYGFRETDFILMTLSRLSSKERYKGYDKVIAAMAQLGIMNKPVKYLIAGSYDAKEYQYLLGLIEQYSLQQQVIMPGFIPDEELEAHFAIADAYVMPSRKEGFGIVFIEAMYYGLPVIAGNADGSTDALLQGRLGQLVNPLDENEIKEALKSIIARPQNYLPDQQMLHRKFGYNTYKEKVNGLAT